MERNRYADLLQVLAIGGVVYGHWLLISATCRDGQLPGLDALDYIGWGRWVTWLFEVMPAFFLVGGYANAWSWMAHHERGRPGPGGSAAGPCACCGQRRCTSWWRSSRSRPRGRRACSRP